MSQSDFGTLDPNVVSGTQLALYLNEWRSALHTLHRGASRPSYATGGMVWVRETATDRWDVLLFSGNHDVLLFSVNPSTGAPINHDVSATEPTVTYAFQRWWDTSGADPVLKQRNAANDAWVSVAQISDGKWLPVYDNSTSGLSATTLAAAIDELAAGKADIGDLQWLGTPIGDTIALPTHLAGVAEPPIDNPNFRYVKLSADETGSGEYNEGVLTGETVSGSAPLVEATAVIDFASSPMDGQTINLLNTENRYIMPGESAGITSNDQMQQITGDISRLAGGSPSYSGAFSATTGQGGIFSSGSQGGTFLADFDSANSPSARTGDHTNVKHETRVYYMRIL